MPASTARRRRYLLISAIIIGFWGTMTAYLMHDELLSPYLESDSFARAAYPTVPTDRWLGVYLPDGSKIGYIQVQTTPGARAGESGTVVQMNGSLRMQVFGTRSTLNINGNAWLARSKGLRDFEFRVRSGDHDLHVDAEVLDGLIDAEVTTAGESFPIQWPVSQELVLWGGMGPAGLKIPNLSKGKTYHVQSFDPVTLSVGATRIEYVDDETLIIGGEEHSARVLELTTSGVTTRAWAAQDGEILRAETPVGFVLQRGPAEEVLAGLNTGGDGAGLLEITAIRPRGKRPQRGADRMRARLSLPPGGAGPPSDATQSQVEPGLYEVVRPEQAVADGTLGDAQRLEYLAHDAFIQSNHPRIEAKSREITSKAETAAAGQGEMALRWAKAAALHDWVYANIAKKPVVSVPSALDVLRTGEGDCNEHTVLYTALARAACIPTRIAIGVVWSEELDGFYYHAWPEVFVGQWVWVDPTLGQPIADAARIKLLTGNIEQWTRLLPYLGVLEIEVLYCQ